MKLFFALVFSLSIMPVTEAAHHEHKSADGNNPFILIARIHVKEGMVEEYLDIANEVDNAVELSEPGMLFHNFDADPDDPLPLHGQKFIQTVKHLSNMMQTHQSKNM
jgi:hypothetical protein